MVITCRPERFDSPKAPAPVSAGGIGGEPPHRARARPSPSATYALVISLSSNPRGGVPPPHPWASRVASPPHPKSSPRR